jgi:hypothetical protein
MILTLCVCAVLVFCLVLLLSSDGTSQNIEIKFISLQEAAEVGQKEMVQGTVSDQEEQVYVLVYPMEARKWWVQPLASPANNDGSWATLCYFGTETEGIGEYFQVVALVADEKLEEGQILDSLPVDKGRSDIITVKRVH